MAEIIYLLCAATSLVAAWLLIRHHARRRTRLLFWTSVGFLGLAANHVLVVVDLVLRPNDDLSLLRSAIAAGAMLTIVFGLIWGSEL